MHMLQRLWKSIDATELSVGGWILSFIGILFVRFFLESYSSPASIGGVTLNFLTGLHYALFFSATSFTVLLVLCIVAPQHRLLSLKVSLYGTGLIILAPLFDLIFSGGKGAGLRYLFDASQNIFLNFITFFGPNLTNGATLGVRLEILIIMVVVGIYVWHCTHSWMRSVVSALLTYTIIFLFGALPLIVAVIGEGHAVSSAAFSNFYLFSIKNSVLIHTLVEPMYIFKNVQGLYGTFFNSITGQIFLFISLIVGVSTFKIIFPEKLHAIIKNSRPERLFYYISLFILGIALCYYFKQQILWNWVDILCFITLLISIKCAWLSSIFFNDVADAQLDSISNQSRPIPSGHLTLRESTQIGIIFLIVSYASAFLIGTTQGFLIVFFSLLAYIYSNKPLRLKRLFPYNTIIMALAGLSIILLGFFFITPAQNMQAFPFIWLVGLFIFLFCICPVRDLKDFQADAEEKIQTIPVMFGEARGRVLVATLAVLALVLIFPLLVNDLRLFILTLPLGFYAFHILTMKKHPERSAFSIFFVLMTFVIVYLFVG
jgi:4-hydroxybenzoate polyprenyltransferase